MENLNRIAYGFQGIANVAKRRWLVRQCEQINRANLWLSLQKNRAMLSSDQLKVFCNPQKKLSKQFRKVRLLGNGGSGQVFLYRDQNGNMFAIKKFDFKNGPIIKPGDNKSLALAVAVAGSREFEIGMKLNHRNFAIVHHLAIKFRSNFDSKKLVNTIKCYMIMEFVPGKTFLGYKKRLSAEQIKQLLRATNHALIKGIVPSDLSLSNTMVTTDGTIKIIDFGRYSKLKPEDLKMRTFFSELVSLVHKGNLFFGK